MIALGLDVASTSGAAYNGKITGVPEMTTFRAARPSGSNEDGWDYGETFSGFYDWLTGLVSLVKPHAIAMEAPLVLAGGAGRKVVTSQTTVRILFGLSAIAELVAKRAGCFVYEVNVQTAKRFFAGTGRADKAAMLARCKQLNWPAKNDHEADAAACWAFYMSTADRAWAPHALPLFAGHR